MLVIARLSNAESIYQVVERFCEECLIHDHSLLYQGEPVWTTANVADLYTRFIETPYAGSAGGGTFDSKWKLQLEGASDEVRRLSAELMLVHLLFPSNVSAGRKRRLVETTLGDLPVPDSRIWGAMSTGIGNAGIGFNTRRDLQIGFMIEFATRVKELDPDGRRHALSDPWRTASLMRSTPRENQREMMHILMHLLHPDSYERIASFNHKRQIFKAFGELAPPRDADTDGDEGDDGSTVDRSLLKIRIEMKRLLAGDGGNSETFDFYDQPYRSVWGGSVSDNGEGATDLESLRWKKQIVLYGPPGTGKTYAAKELAHSLISSAALRRWGVITFLHNAAAVNTAVETNYTRVQLHPNFGYSEFIRGVHLVGNETRYVPGVLPALIDKHNSQVCSDSDGTPLPPLPTVLLLDEINRTDLSAMLGEAFSLFENDKRDTPINLPGSGPGEAPTTLTIPADLYIVGTMNEIDQSLETLDFALRRRFLWKRCPFSNDSLVAIVQARCEKSQALSYFLDQGMPQIEQYAQRAFKLNAQIAAMPDLGPMYEIGHSYFADIAYFIELWLEGKQKSMAKLAIWNKNGQPRPPLTDIWERSLQPLIEQYLVSADDRSTQLESLRETFCAYA